MTSIGTPALRITWHPALTQMLFKSVIFSCLYYFLIICPSPTCFDWIFLGPATCFFGWLPHFTAIYHTVWLVLLKQFCLFLHILLCAKAGTAVARLSHRNSACPSVCLSVTRVDQSKTVPAQITKSLLSAAWKTLVSGSVKLFHKFEWGHPKWGC